MTDHWSCVLSLNAQREPDSGSADGLVQALRSGADLRVSTGFKHNERIDPSSANDELIREVMDFRVTYLLDDRWSAGIQNMRMPVTLTDGFGPRQVHVVLSLQSGRSSGHRASVS